MSRQSEFDKFYADTSRHVVGRLYVALGKLTEAEDAVQEAYARAWQHWSTVSRADNPTAWVQKVAYRVGVDTVRRLARRAVAYRRHGPAENVPEVSPDRMDLLKALQRLPPQIRHAIVLYHLVGLPVADVAIELGAPPGTVKSWLSRGRATLARELTPLPAEGRTSND